MQNKYYVPKIEDLFEGYEFEYQYYDEDTDEYTDGWIPELFDSRGGLGHDLTHQFSEGRVRVPYLTKGQIEAEGWNSEVILIETDEGDEFVDGYTKYLSGDHWFQLENLPENEIQITEKYYRNEVAQVWRIRYSGPCKTINELRTLMKQFNIK